MMKSVLQSFHFQAKRQSDSNKSVLNQENHIAQTEGLKFINQNSINRTKPSDKTASLSFIDLNTCPENDLKQGRLKASVNYSVKQFKGYHGNGDNYHPDFSKVQRKQSCEIRSFHNSKEKIINIDNPLNFEQKPHLIFEGFPERSFQFALNPNIKSIASSTLKLNNSDKLKVKETELSIIASTRSSAKGARTKINKSKLRKSLGLRKFMSKIKRVTFSRNKRVKLKSKKIVNVFTLEERKYSEIVSSPIHQSVLSAGGGNSILYNTIHSERLHRIPTLSLYKEKLSTNGLNVVSEFISPIAAADSYKATSTVSPRKDVTTVVVSQQGSGHCKCRRTQSHDNRHNDINYITAVGTAEEITGCTCSASVIYPKLRYGISSTAVTIPSDVSSRLTTVSEINYSSSVSTVNFPNNKSTNAVTFDRPSETLDTYVIAANPCQPKTNNVADGGNTKGTNQSKDCLYNRLEDQSYELSCQTTCFSNQILDKSLRDIAFQEELSNKTQYQSPQHTLLTFLSKFKESVKQEYSTKTRAVSSQINKCDQGVLTNTIDLSLNDCCVNCVPSEERVSLTPDHTQNNEQRLVASTRNVDCKDIFSKRIVIDNFNNNCVISPHFLCSNCCCHQLKTTRLKDIVCQSSQYTDNLPDSCDDDNATETAVHRDQHVTKGIPGTCHATSALTGGEGERITEKKEGEVKANYIVGTQVQGNGIVYISTTRINCFLPSFNNNNQSDNTNLSGSGFGKSFKAVGDENSTLYSQSHVITPDSNTNFDFQFNNSQYLRDTLSSSSTWNKYQSSDNKSKSDSYDITTSGNDSPLTRHYINTKSFVDITNAYNEFSFSSLTTTRSQAEQHDVLPTKEQKCQRYPWPITDHTVFPFSIDNDIGGRLSAARVNEQLGKQLNSQWLDPLPGFSRTEYIDDDNTTNKKNNVISSKCGVNVTAKSLIPTKSTPLSYLSYLSAAGGESTPTSLLSSLPSIVFTPEIPFHPTPTIETCVRKDSGIISSNSFSYSPTSFIATSLGSATQTTLAPSCFLLTSDNVALTSTLVSDTCLLAEHVKEVKKRKGRRSDVGKDKINKARTNNKKNGFDRETITSVQREGHVRSDGLFGNKQLSLFTQEEKNSFTEKLKDSHFLYTQNPRNPYHHRSNLCFNEANAGCNQQVSSRNYCGTENTVNHFGLLSPFSATKGPPCIEATYCCDCCTSNHHYYTNSGTYKSNVITTTTDSTCVARTTCIEVSESERSWKNSDTFDSDKETCRVSTNETTDCVVCTLGYRGNELSNAAAKTTATSSSTTTATATSSTTTATTTQTDHIPVVCNETVLKEDSLPLFIHADSLFHRKYSGNRSSSSSVLLTEQAAVHDHPTYTAIRSLLPTYSNYVGIASSNSGSSGDGDGGEKHIADTGTAELTLLELKTKPVSTPLYLPPQTKHFLYGNSDRLCCQYKYYSDKRKTRQNFSNKSTNYRCITAKFPSAQSVVREAESLQQLLCGSDNSDNVALSSNDVCGDIESGSETRINFNEGPNMDSTKIINQPGDGFHNSTVYRKCDRISGEGSGEIILSSDYGGVSAGNRVEMKKSSSPCKIPVQQKQKTNMSTGTKHSVKSSQLPRGKSTLIDQTTKISLNKQTTQQTSADSSKLPSKCTGKKSSLVNGDTNVKKQGDKNTTNLKNINVGKSVSSSKIHRNTALSKTKHQTTSDISSKNCNELISVDKHISTVLSEESPEDSESAIDEVKVVNELNDKFRLRSDSESSHASHSSFCSQLSTSSVKSSICLPSSTKSGLGKTSKILTSSCSRLAVSKAETKLQKKPSMLSRTTSSTTVSRTSNSTLSHPSKSSPAHSRLTSRVNTENLQRAVSTGSLRNNSNKSSIPPTGRPNTTVAKSSGLSLRQKKVADSASDLSVTCTTRLGSKIQNKESLKTVSSENLSNKIQNSFGKSCENLTKKKKNVLQASCENLSVKSRNNCVTTSDSTLQQKSISHNKKLTSTQSISNGGLVHQKEKYSGGISLLKASRISGSSSSSIPTAATAADKLDNKKLGNVRSSTSVVSERRTGMGFSSNQEGKPPTNIDRSQIKKSVPATGKKITSLKSNEAIDPLSKKKLVAKTSRNFSDHKVTSNLPTASSKASSSIKKSKLLEAQSNNVFSQTAGKNFHGKATYDSNRLQLDKTKNTLSVNEVENSELHYKELDDAPENEDKVDKDSSSTKPNISENFAYDDYMIITEALSDESISGPSVHVGDLDVSNPSHLSDIDASESYQTSSSASALDISLHEDYVYNGSLVTPSSDNCTDKYTGFQRTQSAVHACREVTSSYQPNTSEDECSEKEEKEETERKEDIEENRVKLKLSDHGVIKSDAYSDKTFDYEASYDCNLSSCGYQQPQKHYGQPYPHQQYPHHPPQHHYHPPHQSTGTENSLKNLSTDGGRGAQSSPQLHSINDSKCVYNFEFEEGQNQKQAEEDGEEKAVGESENLEEKASVVVFKSADIYRVAGHGMPVVEFTPPQIAHHNILRNENSGSGGCNPVSATDRTSKDVTATKTTTVLRGEVDTEGELAGAERSDEEAVDCPVNKLLQRERDRPTSFTQVNVGKEALFKQQISFGEVAVTTTTTILPATIKADVTNSSFQEMADQPGIQSSKLQLGDLHTSQTRTQTYDRDVMCEKDDLSRSTATLFMEQQQQQQLDSNATRQMTGPFLPSEMGFLAGQMLSPCSNDSSSFKDISDGAVTPLSDVQEIFDQETSQLNDISNVDELSDTCKLVSDTAEGETEGVLIEIEDSTLQVSGSPDGEDEIIVEEQDYVVTDERNYDEEATHFTNDDIIGERPIVDAGEDLAEVTLDSNETQNLWFSIEAETDSQYEHLSTSITLENIAESSIGEDVEELLDQTPSIESSNTSSRIHGNLRESILRQLQTQMSEDDAPDILSDEVPPSLEHLQLRTKSVETDFDKSDQQLISGCNEKMINKDSYLHSHQLEPCFHTDSLAENIQQRSADVKLDNFTSQTKNSLSVLSDKNLLETNVSFNEEVQRTHTNSLKYGYKNEFDSLDVNICNNDISQEMELEDGGFVILKNEGVKKTNDNSNQDFTLRQLQGTLNLRKQKILELCGQTESVSSKDIKSPSPTKISIDRKERSPSFKRLDAFCISSGSDNENISPTKTNSSLALNIPKADTLQNLSPKSDEIVSPIKESWIKHEGKWKRGYILDDGSSIPSEKYQDYILKSTPVTPSSEGEHIFTEKYSSAQIVKSDSFEENSLTLKQEQSSNFEEISKCTMELFNQSPVLEEVLGNNETESIHKNSKMHKTVLEDIISSKNSYDSVDGQLDTGSKIKDYGKTELIEAETTHKSQAELTLQTETVQPVITEQKTYSPEIVDDIPFVDMDETVCDSSIVSIASVKLKDSASQDLPEVSPMQETLSSMNMEFKSKEILNLQENNLEQVSHPSVIESTSYSEHETTVDLDTITDDPSTHSSVDELKCEPLIDSGFEHPLHEFDNVSMAVSDIVTTNDTDTGRLIDSGIAQPSDMDWVPITDEYDILPANAEECVPYLNCEPVNANKRMQHDSDDALPIYRKEIVNEIKIDSPRKLIDSESQPMDIPQQKIQGLSTDTELNKIRNKHLEKQEMDFTNRSEGTESSLGNQNHMSMSEQDIYGSSPREVGSLCDEIFSIIGSPTLLNESWKKLSQNKSENDLSKSENELYFDGKRTYRNLPTSRSVYANIIRSSIYENSESESSESLDSISKTSYDDLKLTKDKNNIKLKGQGYSSNEDSPEGLMSSMDFYLDASEFARACWSDRSTLSEFYPVGSHQKLRASDSSTYGKGIYAVKGEDSQDIKLLAEISELDETCGENNHILSQTEHSENIQHNDNSLSRSETYWSPGSSPSMRKPYRRSLSLPFANHDGEDGRSILHCSKVDLEYPVTTAGFGSPPELPSKIGRSLRKHNTVYQWKIGKEKERRDGYDFKVVDVTLGNEQMISENSHEVIHRKHSVSSRERPKSDINVHWPQHVKQVASYFDPRHLREHRESTISRPRPKSDLGGSTLSSEAMKEFLQGKLPQSQSQKTISEMNRTSYLVTKARRMSTPHPIKSRIADRSALTKQKKILGRSHSMPENLNKIHKRRRIHPSGSDPLSDLLSQHSTNDDSSDESEVSMDYSLPDKCHSTRTSQLGLAPLDEIFETENLTYAEALWDHVTMDPDELAFRAGEVIKVTDMIDKDWWWGILEDKDGWFPANFVRLRANQDHHLEEAAKLEGADSSKDSTSNVGKTHQFNSNQARTNVINEIISAEREYVHQLDDVLQGYVVQAKKRPDMFPDDKISTIFGNLEDIYTFSKKFFKSLEVSLKDDLHQSEVGHCFIEHRKGFEIYSDYCNNHPHACDQLKELCKNKRYRHFFEGCRLLQDMKQIPLEGFLLTPVQKICKYPLQLAELLKYTSTSHPDYRDVCEALDAMKKIACLINERKRRMESIEKIAEWQATVEDWEGPDLLETSSELIYSGELSKVNSSGWTQERYFFLFDHQLIYCRKDLLKKNSFSFRGRIYLDHSKIYPVVDGRDPQFNVYVKNGWKLHDNKRNKSFLVFSKNAVEKDRWLKAFDEERKKVKSDQENGFTIPPSLRKSCARNSFRTKTQPERPKEKLMKKNMPMSFRHQQELWKNLPAHATLPRGMTNPTTLLERLPHTSANKKRSWFSFAGKKKR